MRWVKAIEELPKKSGAYYCLDLKYGHKKILHYSVNGYSRGSSSLFKKRPRDIEWLDESNNKVSDCRP